MPKRKASAEIDPDWAGFPDRLKKAIGLRQLERGWSQRRVAELADYDAPNLSRLLRRKPVGWEGLTANSLLAFARALDVNPAWLLTGQEPSGLEHGQLSAADERRFDRDAKKLSKPPHADLPERAGK